MKRRQINWHWGFHGMFIGKVDCLSWKLYCSGMFICIQGKGCDRKGIRIPQDRHGNISTEGEKCKCSLKNIQNRPSKFQWAFTRNESTLKGLVLMFFISPIIRSSVVKRMNDSGLSKKYSVEKMFLELEKLSKVKLSDGSIVETERTARQKDIFKGLGLK